MATLNIRLYRNLPDGTSKFVDCITLRGKRPSERELSNYYGNDHDVEEMYYIRKPNEWGIKWVICYKSRYGGTYWTTAGTKSLPNHDYIRVRK